MDKERESIDKLQQAVDATNAELESMGHPDDIDKRFVVLNSSIQNTWELREGEGREDWYNRVTLGRVERANTKHLT